jgi:hypothetical protein
MTPKRLSASEDWPHHELAKRVREAIQSLPAFFQTRTSIEGISAVDIFTLNSVLGAAIENQLVATLNLMRSVWDPDEKYLLYSFIRQAQTFPDVLLKKTSGDQQTPIMGIELKGWYLLAKEGEPSFRFQVTASACAPQDLIVVVPWALDNVISGSPKVFPPYIEFARYAADYRTYHWQELRESKSDREITVATGVQPYPKKTDQILDQPRSDKGGNFGRFARTGLMDSYLQSVKGELLCGIGAEYWLTFFKIFQEQIDNTAITAALDRLKDKVKSAGKPGRPDEKRVAAMEIVAQLERLIACLP